ncbi:hypothetical protein NCAS_0G01500 [Naumovozyma castellii]|uniref:Uncharacterized protein n=1 Tax=Naumovozyma castellii TaxID=27288 RepID=G0VI03_NAUCA|nr:hypothetical protein NCAS_0G01500 [Naumovozyma castellii CBS 4309]CCC71037.1 hypothetical protein NCAS_0G01500 [Naumovozyma castellii CBS 4309]
MDNEQIWQNLNWPKNATIRKRKIRDPTFTAVQSILYNGGLLAALLYSIATLLIQPILADQYEQRHEFALAALLKVRKLISTLQSRLRTTPVSILGANETQTTIERCTQTSLDTDNDFADENDTPLESISQRIYNLKWKLSQFNANDSRTSNAIEGFNFQTKLVKDQIDNLNTPTKAIDGSKNIVASLREMKGWFVNGKIPY